MRTADRPLRGGPLGVLAIAVAAAMVFGACDAAAGPSQSPVDPTSLGAASSPAVEITEGPTIEVTATPTPAPTEAPSPAATPVPAATPTPSPSPSSAPSPSPSPTAAPAVTVDDYAWAYDKHPMSLAGTAGTTTWTHLLFGAKTVSLKWTATPESGAACTFKYKLESKALPKAVSGTQKVKSSKGSGSKSVKINYGDGKLTVTTDCATYTIKATSTGHPGLTIKQSNAPYAITGETADELNRGLAKAYANWGLRYGWKYYKSPVRVNSHTTTVTVKYKLPKWTPPEGVDQSLVDAYNAALRNMRTHVEGQAVIGIQAAGRFQDRATKTRFPSVAAMEKYFDVQSDKSIEAASNRTSTYNEDSDFGAQQGAYIP